MKARQSAAWFHDYDYIFDFIDIVFDYVIESKKVLEKDLSDEREQSKNMEIKEIKKVLNERPDILELIKLVKDKPEVIEELNSTLRGKINEHSIV